MTLDNIQYSLHENVATIRIDDGKRNALSPEVLRDIYAAFDQAESDNAIVIITGREEVFSAGFDLKVMQKGGTRALRMLHSGYALPARVMSYPYPVIAACNGHAMAMGFFLMLSADYIIGTRGDFKIAANEVAIGLTLPRFAIEVLRARVEPAAFQRAANLSEFFDTESALSVGIFDELAESEKLMARANAQAELYKNLDLRAHKETKLRSRSALIRKLRRSAWIDSVDAALLGLRRIAGR